VLQHRLFASLLQPLGLLGPHLVDRLVPLGPEVVAVQDVDRLGAFWAITFREGGHMLLQANLRAADRPLPRRRKNRRNVLAVRSLPS
jgi:hypothetical protein